MRFRPGFERLESRTVLSVSERFVAQAYVDVLQRPVDPSGLAHWSGILDQSVPRSDVVNALAQTAEYRTRVVQELYQELLRRPADPSGLNGFVNFLANGGTVNQVRAALAGSAEYFQGQGGGTNEGFLDALYRDALHRAPDDQGRAAYLQALAGGTTPAQVAGAVFGSAEAEADRVNELYHRLLHRDADLGGLGNAVQALQQGAREEDVLIGLVSSEEYFGFYQPFVRQAYQALLARAVDAGGLNYWTQQLAEGATHEQVARALTASAEYRSLVVQDLYQTLLRRPADPNGLNGFVSFLANGGTVSQVRAVLAGSAEYLQNQGGGSNEGFLDALYRDALGRAPDPNGRAVFLQALAGGTSRADIAAAVFGSPEFQLVVVGSLYQQLLHRAPDPSGLGVAVNALQHGATEEEIAARLAGSEEFAPTAPGSYNPLARDDVLTPADVSQLLQRAAAASASSDAIIAVVDRGGRILGVRVESGVSPALTGDPAALTFAIDGAVAKARTAAFFANNQAPLTSRTIQFISQTTITQREVESNPSVPDPSSPLRGPGFVAPVGLGGHFPPNIPNTPPVDLFGIEHTNRDSLVNPGSDHVKGTADDLVLPNRFNVPDAFIPADIPAYERLAAPESYGLVSGVMPNAQARGIATLPGGIPLYKRGNLVGGIGVFFPGTTGFATEENSSLSATFNPTRPDRSLEAEWVAFVAAGGSAAAGAPVGVVGGIAPLSGFDLPFGRIDLVGVALDIFGPGGTQGPSALVAAGRTYGVGDPNSGRNVAVDAGPDGMAGTSDDLTLKYGTPVPEGWLVAPHDGVGVRAADVVQAINQGVAEAQRVRAQIRLPLESRTRMVFTVADTTGAVLGLYRMPDATVFSIDVAVAKARNVAYYDNPAQLQPADRVAGLPPGVAFTNRTFRYLAQPRFPEGIDGTPPAPFSVLNDGGVNPLTGLAVGPRLPASSFQSVLGFDAFNPQTNFRAPTDPGNQNGIVFFPGSQALYRGAALLGGLGVSGDGVDQDDVVTSFAGAGFEPPAGLQADQFSVGGVRLPYQKFPRNPEG
jgi:uncharacterized protein GlcG (DUF336 family)